MNRQGKETPTGQEHFGARYRHAVYGGPCRDDHRDGNGPSAASGDDVTARCPRCGCEISADADTGLAVSDCRGDEREPEPVRPVRQAPQGECLYTVLKQEEKYILSGITKRVVAEKLGLRHLTVIIVPFVTDGPDQSRWILHNRHDKQIAKGKSCVPLSLNLFGGHCGPPEDDITGQIGQTIGSELLCENALRELSEELLCRKGKEKRLELWREGVFTGEYLCASPFEVKPESLIPIGFTEYAAKDNVEYSFVFALPVPGSRVEQLIAADNYEKHSQTDGTSHEADIALPVLLMAESELQRLWESRDPRIEVCDAVTRLWEEPNHAVYQKLLECIGTFRAL